MSGEKHETIADIVAEMMECADRMEKRGLYDLRECGTDYLRVLAYFIEAAANREREAGAEAAQICGEIGEMVGREAACDKSSQVGNAAAMREACANIAEYAKTAACHTEDAHLLGYLNQIERWAEAALSAPPRNCDVGTAEEQSDRLEAFCLRHKNCSSCPCKYTEKTSCSINWARMPYEEGGAE